jgi:hypothetical protein
VKELFSIGYLSISDIGSALAEQLRSIYPDIKNSPSGFATHLHPKNDPKFRAVVELLDRAGLQARYGPGSLEAKKEYRVNAIREYDKADLEACELLYLDLLHPKRGVSSVSRSPQGYAVMDVRGIPEDPTLSIHETPDAYVVSDGAKRLLESAGLKHLAFKPTVVTARGSDVGPFISWEAAGHEPWWEITSERWMPCLSTATELWRMSDERPMTELERHLRDYGRGVLPVERPFRTPELRYARKDIGEWSTFCDIARTYEPFGRRPDLDRRLLVVSQRFYQFCRVQGIEAEWVPVRVDE